MARIRLGDMLVKVGLIDEMQLQSALAHQRQWGGKLGDVLVNNGFLDEMMLWRGLSKQLNVPLVSLPQEQITPGIEKAIPLDLCQKHQIMPLQRDDKGITVATSDPNNVGGIDEVSFRVGVRLRVVLAPDREIEWAIRRFYHGDSSPCPPPRLRRGGEAPAAQTPPSSTKASTPPAGEALGRGAGTSAAELAALAARALASTMPPATSPMSAPTSPPTSPAPAGAGPQGAAPYHQPWWNAPEPSAAEPAIREAAHLLRFLVEACVQRGVFTREQYLQKLKSL